MTLIFEGSLSVKEKTPGFLSRKYKTVIQLRIVKRGIERISFLLTGSYT